MNEKVKEQILAIRDTGATNMFDINAVGRLANERGYYELVNFLEEKTKEYLRFILTGEAKEITDAAFMRKPARFDDLIAWDKVAKQRSKFAIEKTIELEKKNLNASQTTSLPTRISLRIIPELMQVDKNGVKHCILVKGGRGNPWHPSGKRRLRIRSVCSLSERLKISYERDF
jgi:hypothetical protein